MCRQTDVFTTGVIHAHTHTSSVKGINDVWQEAGGQQFPKHTHSTVRVFPALSTGTNVSTHTSGGAMGQNFPEFDL